MAKVSVKYICSCCQSVFSRWAGRCEECGSWNTISELEQTSGAKQQTSAILRMNEISTVSEKRILTGIPDLDMVFGGGLVPGSFMLIGGEPGAGKSTLILEIARTFPGRMYYFSGEESPSQIKMRSDRMVISSDQLYLSRETDLDSITSRIRKEKPDLAVIDSVQTVFRSGGNLPGSPGQLREAALALMEVSKETAVPVLVTGHITKDGSIAGPRLLEHMVDAVLYMESDRLNHFRIVRAIKNRFGPVGEAAIFEMRQNGLYAVSRFMHERTRGPGRVYTAMLEGSRAIGVEVQSLVAKSSFGPARRTAEGLDSRRLLLMAAVLEKYLRLNLSEQDIFVNLAGGLSADEPALDLALCASIVSSYREIALDSSIAFLGEVGLSGEIRPVGRIPDRIKELTSLGFKEFYVPEANRQDTGSSLRYLSRIEEIADIFLQLSENK